MRLLLPIVQALLLVAALSVGGCERSAGGPLEPAPQDGVSIVANKTAMLVDGQLVTHVTGDWSSTGSNGLTIHYINKGALPLRITLSDIKMRHMLGKAVLSIAIDYTGVNMTDKREDNDRGNMVYSLDKGGGSGVLVVPGHSTRVLNCYLSNFANEGSVARGDKITATIPLATRSADVSFTAIRPQWWMFW